MLYGKRKSTEEVILYPVENKLPARNERMFLALRRTIILIHKYLYDTKTD